MGYTNNMLQMIGQLYVVASILSMLILFVYVILSLLRNGVSFIIDKIDFRKINFVENLHRNVSMDKFSDIKYKIVYFLGFLPVLSKFIFKDDERILKKLKDAGILYKIVEMTDGERRLLHFSLGMKIRNDFYLWHPKNPYTMQAISHLPVSQQGNSPHHPDNYSWAIIRKLIIESGVHQTDILALT